MAIQRQSNIELCRIVSILLVMLVHTTFATFGWETQSLGIQTLAAFSIIGVNVFVLITGYFSVKLKWTTLVNIAFICFFWMLVKNVGRFLVGETISISALFFITKSNWFIPCYIGLLFLSPLLNLFSDKANKKTLLGGAFSLLLIEVWFDWLPPTPGLSIGTQGGCSVLSFAILYLVARYIKLYGIPAWFKKSSLIIYILCSLSLVVLNVISIKIGHPLPKLVFTYNNPIVILSSVAFLMMFEQVNFSSKSINHIAKSTLAVLLGHTALFFLYTKQFSYIYDNYSGLQVVAYWALAIFVVFCTSVVIDQIRILLYKPIEKWMQTRIKNNVFFPIDNKS